MSPESESFLMVVCRYVRARAVGIAFIIIFALSCHLIYAGHLKAIYTSIC